LCGFEQRSDYLRLSNEKPAEAGFSSGGLLPFFDPLDRLSCFHFVRLHDFLQALYFDEL
jgi:hypothetical protein